MTFKIAVTKPRTFKRTVKVKQPRDGTGFVTKTFSMTFKDLGLKEFEELQAQYKDDDVAFIREIAEDWDIIDADSDKNAVYDFNDDDVVQAVLNVTYIKIGIIESFIEFTTGGARRGN